MAFTMEYCTHTRAFSKNSKVSAVRDLLVLSSEPYEAQYGSENSCVRVQDLSGCTKFVPESPDFTLAFNAQAVAFPSSYRLPPYVCTAACTRYC